MALDIKGTFATVDRMDAEGFASYYAAQRASKRGTSALRGS
jgi:hypothetical protein